MVVWISRFYVLSTLAQVPSQTNALPPRQQDQLSKLVPGFIKTSLFLKRTLVKIAINPEKVAKAVSTLASSTTNAVSYERFSADNGVCSIGLNKYKELKHIEDLTLQYLGTDAIQDRPRKVGTEIARDYLSRNRPSLVIESASSTSLTRPDLKIPSCQTTLSLTPGTSDGGTSAADSTNTSYEIPDDSARNEKDASRKVKGLNRRQVLADAMMLGPRYDGFDKFPLIATWDISSQGINLW